MLFCWDSGFCCISLKSVCGFVSVGQWLGWTVNCLLTISPAVSSVLNFILEFYSWGCFMHVWLKSQLDTWIGFIFDLYFIWGSLLLMLPIFEFSPHFSEVMDDLKSVLLFCIPERLEVLFGVRTPSVPATAYSKDTRCKGAVPLSQVSTSFQNLPPFTVSAFWWNS
jgi:hypothetical protein